MTSLPNRIAFAHDSLPVDLSNQIHFHLGKIEEFQQQITEHCQNIRLLLSTKPSATPLYTLGVQCIYDDDLVKRSSVENILKFASEASSSISASLSSSAPFKLNLELQSFQSLEAYQPKNFDGLSIYFADLKNRPDWEEIKVNKSKIFGLNVAIYFNRTNGDFSKYSGALAEDLDLTENSLFLSININSPDLHFPFVLDEYGRNQIMFLSQIAVKYFTKRNINLKSGNNLDTNNTTAIRNNDIHRSITSLHQPALLRSSSYDTNTSKNNFMNVESNISKDVSHDRNYHDSRRVEAVINNGQSHSYIRHGPSSSKE